jgi:Trk-type K+ transport system membrane component
MLFHYSAYFQGFLSSVSIYQRVCDLGFKLGLKSLISYLQKVSISVIQCFLMVVFMDLYTPLSLVGKFVRSCNV